MVIHVESDCAIQMATDIDIKMTLPTAPKDAQIARLCRNRTNFHPLQVCPVTGVDPLNLLARGVFTL